LHCRPVPKADILDRVRPGAVVEEGNLTVANLLRPLNTYATGRNWIIPVPRLGYRMVVPDSPAQRPTGIDRAIVAALTFQNLSGGAVSSVPPENVGTIHNSLSLPSGHEAHCCGILAAETHPCRREL
jgi:hypothetical protein